ncbi:histidine kinase [Actinomycetes bacterium KLBMP 9797]
MGGRIGVAVRTRPVVRDAVVALALLAACAVVNSPTAVVTTGNRITGEGPHTGRLVTWWVAAAIAVVSIAARSQWPASMLVLGAAAVGTHMALQVPFMIIDLAVPVLLYSVALRYDRAASVGALAGLLIGVAGWSLYSAANSLPVPGLPDRIAMVPDRVPVGGPAPPGPVRSTNIAQNTWSGVLLLGSVLIASWATGSAARSRRARARDLERQQGERAALAVIEERARISRELHDVVAHGLSVMVTQAQGAAAALDRKPADTRTALEAIVATGRDSLADMRRVLARVDGIEDVWHPQPGLDRLPALVGQVTEAGTKVRFRVDGERSTLSSTVDFSAYRIVQEALTNTMKHAGPGASAEVAVSFRDSHVEIEVRDDGHGGTAGGGAGHGLRGMRERVYLLGGRFSAGRGEAGGFVVRAVLPVRGQDA